MHDTQLLQLINDDLAPAEQLLGLLQDEHIALKGRDMQVLEKILARKQSLIILLEQHGRRRSEILAGLGLTTNRSGLESQPLKRGSAVAQPERCPESPAGSMPGRQRAERAIDPDPAGNHCQSVAHPAWRRSPDAV